MPLIITNTHTYVVCKIVSWLELHRFHKIEVGVNAKVSHDKGEEGHEDRNL